MKDSVWPDAGKKVPEAEDSLSEGNPEEEDVAESIFEEVMPDVPEAAGALSVLSELSDVAASVAGLPAGEMSDEGSPDIRVSDAVMFASEVSSADEPMSALSARVLSARPQPVSIRMIIRNIIEHFCFIGVSFRITE